MKSIPIEEALASPDLSSNDREYLLVAEEVLNFARNDLGLKTKGSYKKYLKLDRPWVTQVVVAAHKDRLEPYLFKFPLFGALPYRGYFSEEKARTFAEKIAKEHNLDVLVRPVPAYSTTGWLSDPIVSTMFRSKIDFAELLLHELVHLQFYFDGEADFNEAFATWFAEKGLRRLIAQKPELLGSAPELEKKLTEDEDYQMKFAQLIDDFTKKAHAFYKEKRTDEERKGFFESLRIELLKLNPQRKWPHYPDLNNAYLVSSATYYLLLPKIDAFARQNKLDERAMLDMVIKSGPKFAKKL